MKQPPNPFTGSVKLVDWKTRVVELLGPEPAGSRWPTDVKLFVHSLQTQFDYMYGPQPVAYCFQAGDRTAKFLVDKGSIGDAFLDRLAKVRLARPYGVNGWVVES